MQYGSSSKIIHSINKIFIGVRCWSAGFRGQGLGKEKKSVLRKVDIPIYPDRAECQKKINTALKITTGRNKIKEVELTSGEVLLF